MTSSPVGWRRYQVSGIDQESGLETEIVVEASSDAMARAKAESKGITVVEVRTLDRHPAVTNMREQIVVTRHPQLRPDSRTGARSLVLLVVLVVFGSCVAIIVATSWGNSGTPTEPRKVEIKPSSTTKLAASDSDPVAVSFKSFADKFVPLLRAAYAHGDGKEIWDATFSSYLCDMQKDPRVATDCGLLTIKVTYKCDFDSACPLYQGNETLMFALESGKWVYFDHKFSGSRWWRGESYLNSSARS